MTSLDLPALADRLYADALASALRQPDGFGRARVDLETSTLEQYVRKRAEKHQDEVKATDAELERAFERAQERWRRAVGVEPNGSGGVRPSVGVVEFLKRSAQELLQPDGREMILLVDHDEPAREILRWRFVSLVLPPSILIAAAAPRGRSVPGRVRLLHDSLAPDQPVAEQHIHHAAAVDFDELWESLRLQALVHPGRLIESLRSSRAACPGLHREECPIRSTESERDKVWKKPAERPILARHMTQWADLIRQAFIAGRLLDRHLHHAGPLVSCEDCREARSLLSHFTSGRTKPYRLTATAYPWPEDRYALERRWREARKASRGRKAAEHHRVMAPAMAEERATLTAAFRHLGDRSNDELYERLLVQYLRVKSALYNLLVQPCGERGLDRFLESFRQTKLYMPDSNALFPRERDEPGLDLRATEYRIAPDAWLERKKDEIDAGRQRAAWLIHFKWGPLKQGKLPRYGSAVRLIESDADKILRGLRARPRRLKWLCGVDLCGVESAQPLWVGAETFRHLRKTSREIAGSRPELALHPLRLTLHVGEDFEWLTSGVRAVAEPFHWRLIERGDRIGHGIAITMEPEGWWARNDGRVMRVRRLDRLLDLAFLAKYVTTTSREEDEWLQQEAERSVKELGLRTDDSEHRDLVDEAKALWKKLGERRTRQLMRTRQEPEGALHEVWIHQILWSRPVQRKADEDIALKVDDDWNGVRSDNQRIERDLLAKARDPLIREMARWKVCIESNPSSNLVVAGLDAMGASQDFLQERPTSKGKGAGTLTWTINTDDPITFSTTLADEYAYAWAGMVLRAKEPYDPAYARAMLDEAAATSLRMSFVPRQRRETEEPKQGRGVRGRHDRR